MEFVHITQAQLDACPRKSSDPTHYNRDGSCQCPARTLAEAERIIELLGKYGEAKFGDEWWPSNAAAYMAEGHELEELLDPGAAERRRQEGVHLMTDPLYREPGVYTCPCCGDIVMGDGTTPVCVDCTAAGCEARPARGDGELGYWECQREDQGDEE